MTLLSHLGGSTVYTRAVRSNGSRSDAKNNREQLLWATGQLLGQQGSVTLSELAKLSGVSRSTTYRNFSTSQAAIDAYIDEFLTDFEAVTESNRTTGAVSGTDHWRALRLVCHSWGELVALRSEALIHVRSTDGFLSRVRDADPVISRIHGLVRTAIANGWPPNIAGTPSDRQLDYGVFLWNLLTDPRELLDLASHENITVQEATTILTEDLIVLLEHHLRPPPARAPQ